MSPIIPENHCSEKLLQLMTRDDKGIWDLIEIIEKKRSMGIHVSYMKIFAKNLHVRNDQLFLDNKLVVPATIRGTFSAMLHETHPGQFGMKSLAEYIWWPHIYREIYHHGKSLSQCLKASENLKVLLGTDNITKLPTLTCAKDEINPDFSGPLDAFWGTQNYILLCIERFTKFPSAKIVNNTSSNTMISFLNDYCHLHDSQGRLESAMGRAFYHTSLKIYAKNTTFRSFIVQSATLIKWACAKTGLHDKV